MYKGFITRYPEHSIPIIIQIIDSASLCDIRVNKKVQLLNIKKNEIYQN